MFKKGDKVKIAEDGLQKHSKTIPVYAGYTQACIDWRSSLRKLLNSKAEGEIITAFENNSQVTVRFNGICYGVDEYMLEKIPQNKFDRVEQFVRKHTDEQCGLDVADFNVFNSLGTIRVIVSSKRISNVKRIKKASSLRGMKTEWKAQADDLIDEIGKDPNTGYGGLGIELELWSVSNHHFELREKEVK